LQFRRGEGKERHIPLVKHFHKSPYGKAAKFGGLPQRDFFNLKELCRQKKPRFGSGNGVLIGYFTAYLHGLSVVENGEKYKGGGYRIIGDSFFRAQKLIGFNF
jgi:hypothetical protein